ncbi:MAG: hypothetical protein AAF585_18445, partial [Verrucomicrobiota bacterium]
FCYRASHEYDVHTRRSRIPAVLAVLAAPSIGLAQQNQGQNTHNNHDDGETTTSGWRGYLSIDYYGNKFIMPYSRIVSISSAEYLVDGGGKVIEFTIDTTGQVSARFYYLDTMLGDTNLNAPNIINNRLKDIQGRAENKTGVDTRRVVKHYPDTTHAKTIEFNLYAKEHIDVLMNHITHEWIEEGGRGSGRTLRFE